MVASAADLAQLTIQDILQLARRPVTPQFARSAATLPTAGLMQSPSAPEVGFTGSEALSAEKEPLLDELRSIRQSVRNLALQQREHDLEVRSLKLELSTAKLMQEEGAVGSEYSRSRGGYRSRSRSPDFSAIEARRARLVETPKREIFLRKEAVAQTEDHAELKRRVKALREEQESLQLQIQMEAEARREIYGSVTVKEQPASFQTDELRNALKEKERALEKLKRQRELESRRHIQELAEYERRVGALVQEEMELEARLERSRGAQEKSQKVIRGEAAMRTEHAMLEKELQAINEEESRRAREREEVAAIQEKSVSLLKAQIAQHQHRACNNCLLYISEKRDFTLNLEQQNKLLRRLEHEHHQKKQEILLRCAKAMDQLQRQPGHQINRLKEIERTVRATEADTHRLNSRIETLNKQLSEKSEIMSAKNEQINSAKQELADRKTRLKEYEERLAELQAAATASEKEAEEMKQANAVLTKQVGKNAAKTMIIKEREGELEDQRNKLQKKLLELQEATQKKK